MPNLHAELERQFTKVHSVMEREVINGFSLVYHLKGKQRAEPGLVKAHMDVVPVEPGTEKD